jgi:sulfite reductase beta subunit-like hemoprotein
VGQQNGGKYAIFLGGNHLGTRVGEAVLQKVQMQELPGYLDKAFAFWAAEGKTDEHFGDFVNRMGLDRIRTILAPPEE